MSENPGSKDKSLETLDFIINVLKEHENNLDKTINELSTVVEQTEGAMAELKSKVEESEEKINNLQNDVTNLISYFSHSPMKNLAAEAKQQEPQIQAAPLASSTVIQVFSTLILRCNKWTDFQDLAMHAQKLSFSYTDDEKGFQVNATNGNQMIMYAGALPNLSIILKKWLSGQLDIKEQDILEGFLDRP